MKETAIQAVLTIVLGTIVVGTTVGIKTYFEWSAERDAARYRSSQSCDNLT